MEKQLSAQYFEALKLHNKILASAQLAQQSLWEMCNALKEMRDSKLYKEFDYANFEDYCNKEFGFSARNARNYISIVENIDPEKRKSISAFGVTKLSLLATISHSQQDEIVEKVDVENVSVRELKDEIGKLKATSADTERKLDEMNRECLRVAKQRDEAWNKLDDAQAVIKDLESRPIEVVASEPSDNERRLKETIKSLELESIRHNDELEAQYREDERQVRQMLEDEKQTALARQKAEYEEKIKALQLQSGEELSEGAKNRLKFEVCYRQAFDICNQLVATALQSDKSKELTDKVKKLVKEISSLL